MSKKEDNKNNNSRKMMDFLDMLMSDEVGENPDVLEVASEIKSTNITTPVKLAKILVDKHIRPEASVVDDILDAIQGAYTVMPNECARGAEFIEFLIRYMYQMPVDKGNEFDDIE